MLVAKSPKGRAKGRRDSEGWWQGGMRGISGGTKAHMAGEKPKLEKKGRRDGM